MLESELGKKTPLKKTEFLTGGPAGLLNYRCHLHSQPARNRRLEAVHEEITLEGELRKIRPPSLNNVHNVHGAKNHGRDPRQFHQIPAHAAFVRLEGDR